MAEPIFDHDRLDVYRLSIDCVASSFSTSLVVRRWNVPQFRVFLPRPMESMMNRTVD